MISLWLSFYIWHAFELTRNAWYEFPYFMTALVLTVAECFSYLAIIAALLLWRGRDKPGNFTF